MSPEERFELGVVVATPAALEVLKASCVDPAELLARHVAGDWGDVPPEDAQENEFSVRHGFRVLSAYQIRDARLWVITEADRSATTVLLPEEY